MNIKELRINAHNACEKILGEDVPLIVSIVPNPDGTDQVIVAPSWHTFGEDKETHMKQMIMVSHAVITSIKRFESGEPSMEHRSKK